MPHSLPSSVVATVLGSMAVLPGFAAATVIKASHEDGARTAPPLTVLVQDIHSIDRARDTLRAVAYAVNNRPGDATASAASARPAIRPADTRRFEPGPWSVIGSTLTLAWFFFSRRLGRRLG